MAEKSKILVIGATEYIGKNLVEATAKHGHQTFELVRETSVSDPVKEKLVESFKASGVIVIYVRTFDVLLLIYVCLFVNVYLKLSILISKCTGRSTGSEEFSEGREASGCCHISRSFPTYT